jgi:hypothetical protein
VWSGGAHTHRGTTVAGFPNLLILVGPHTWLSHTSLIYMIESQVTYTIEALLYRRRTGSAVEARPEAQAAYNRGVQRRMRATVWTTGGCPSWYLDAHHQNTTRWPTFTWRFRRATRRFQPTEYPIHHTATMAPCGCSLRCPCPKRLSRHYEPLPQHCTSWHRNCGGPAQNSGT